MLLDTSGILVHLCIYIICIVTYNRGGGGANGLNPLPPLTKLFIKVFVFIKFTLDFLKSCVYLIITAIVHKYK